MGQLIGPMLD